MRWYSEGTDDDEGIAEIVETLRGSELSVTMNLSWTDGLIRQAEDLEGLVAEPIARALPAAVLQPFRRANNRYVGRGIDWLPSVRERFEREKQLVLDLHQAGVRILAGTDASTAGVLPGSSLHRDIGILVDAGLTPLDAVRAATLEPGRFSAERMDAEDKFGQVAEGYRADILVLNGNPLDDISHLGDAYGVVARGRWWSQAALDERVDALVERSERLTPIVIEIEDSIKGGEMTSARERFDSARDEFPGEIFFSQYPPFFIGYGYLYGDEGYHSDPVRLQKALTLYQMYAEAYPEYHSAHYMLALAQEANGDPASAIAALEIALSIHPYYPDARNKLEALRQTVSD